MSETPLSFLTSVVALRARCVNGSDDDENPKEEAECRIGHGIEVAVTDNDDTLGSEYGGEQCPKCCNRRREALREIEVDGPDSFTERNA